VPAPAGPDALLGGTELPEPPGRDVLLAFGEQALAAGELDGATAAFAAAQAQGLEADGLFGLGRVDARRGAVEEAIAAFTAAEQAGHPEAAAHLGVLLERRGDEDGALAAWARADRAGSARGAFNLGGRLELQGDRERALPAYRRAAQRGDPEGRAAVERLSGDPSVRRTLRLQSPMMKGGDVRWVQAALREQGLPVAVDGFYGPETSRAVAQVQARHDLNADGIVGPATWAVLELSPSVRHAVASLDGPATASRITAELLRLHPEYAGGRGRGLRLDPEAGERRPVRDWLNGVRALVPPSVPRLHGRVVILGLAALDPALAEQLRREGFAEALRGEVREPLDLTPSSAAAAEERFDFVSSATPDLPSSEDLLGFTPLVDALHALLDDPKTTLPLAIAVTAPWGAGKSSLMCQLKARLESPPPEPPPHRRWATVQFDAWKYERSERLWAALAKAIYEQPQERMTPWQRVRFRVRLEWRRLGWWKFAAITLWPLLAAAGAVTLALNAELSANGATVAVLSSAAAIVAAASRYWGLVSDPFKRAIERHAKRPDYEAQLGFTAEADHDVRTLTRLLAEGERDGLAVFVDDLDRCSSAHVVEVVEAMNQIFNATGDHRCVFVLGLDRDVVATNIDVAYSETVAQLREAGNALGQRFGQEFLAKLVQLSVAIPQPDRPAMEALLSRITGNPVPVPVPAVPEAEVREVQADLRAREDDQSLESVAHAAADLEREARDGRSTVVAEAVRRVVAERIRDSSEVVEAEFAALEYLEANPRQLKRFHNAFRLQLYVANSDPRVALDFTGDQLLALARWVALRLRWPELGDAMMREPRLLSLLEREVNGEVDPERSQADRDLLDGYRSWLEDGDLRAVLAEPEPARRLSALPPRSFLRVA